MFGLFALSTEAGLRKLYGRLTYVVKATAQFQRLFAPRLGCEAHHEQRTVSKVHRRRRGQAAHLSEAHWYQPFTGTPSTAASALKPSGISASGLHTQFAPAPPQ